MRSAETGVTVFVCFRFNVADHAIEGTQMMTMMTSQEVRNAIADLPHEEECATAICRAMKSDPSFYVPLVPGRQFSIDRGGLRFAITVQLRARISGSP
jgi:hypothetical protein